ncbi:MAG: S41 family peptidase [Cyanobacteriota bacterium]|nr:S41 family peptidase [Cyanobacteriota bacterium]
MLLLALLWCPPALALNDAQQLVVEAWRLVNQSYVDPARFEAVNWRHLRQKALERPIQTYGDAHGAIEAMLRPLGDPYTRLLRPDDYRALRGTTRGSVSGVGLQLALRDGQIVVIAPLDGSPAAAAGIASGSEILRVDGRPAAELGLEGTAAALRGAAGTEVLVELRPPQGQPRDLALQRRTVDLQPLQQRLMRHGDQRIGYVRITQFSEPVPRQFAQALAQLTADAGTDGLDGLILDLRNNSGGLVDAGLAVANDLLDAAPIVATIDRDGGAVEQDARPGRLYGGPMLTLVNGGTASASEILAGALQDDGRSRLLGRRTFGKGLIQTLITLSDGSGLAVTVARYETPNGRDIQNQGIAPDLVADDDEPLNPGGDDDPWLQTALAALGQTIDSAAPSP